MDTKTTKRMFISFNFPEETLNEINAAISALKKNNPNLKWVDINNTHLTLYFLGEVNIKEENTIKLILQNFERKFCAIDFSIENLGAFPNFERPKIIYLTCRQTNGNYVFKIQEMLGAMLKKHDIKFENKPWKPHITLARVGQGQKFNFKDQEIKPIKCRVDGIYLMESTLTSEGPIYKVIEKFKLN